MTSVSYNYEHTISTTNVSSSIAEDRDKHIQNLEKIKIKIETMSKKHHIEILKILTQFSNIKLNENKSGVFINLMCLPNEAVDELVKYIQYIDEQESTIMTIEAQKSEYKNVYFHEKPNKEEVALLTT
jgi:hypothetical protein